MIDENRFFKTIDHLFKTTDCLIEIIDHPKVNAVVGLIIYGGAWAFAGAIFAHLAW